MTAGRVLVTGASGFVGRQVIEPLVSRGWEVHAIGSAGRHPSARWHRIDLLDAESRRRLIRSVRPDALVHCAWVATPGQYSAAPENLDWAAATLGLVREVLAAGATRLVLVGSCAEYDWENAPDRPWREDDPVRPATLYGITKDATHRMTAALARQASVPLAWARLFHLLGPCERPGRLVPGLLGALKQGHRFETGPGHHCRDWLDVRDAGRALAMVLDRGVTGAVNIGSGTPHRVADLVAMAAALAGRPDLEVVGTRSGGPAAIVADIARLRQLTGFAPSISLQQALQEQWDSLRPSRGAGPPRPLSPAYQEAASLFRQDRLLEAEGASRALLAASPEDTPALNLLGVVLRRLGRAAEGEAVLERAAASAPNDDMPLINLGNLMLDQGDPDRAAEAFERARARRPPTSATLQLLGRAYSRAGRLDLALQILTEAMAQTVNEAGDIRPVLAERARSYFAANRPADAFADLDRAEAAPGPHDPELTVLRAQMLRLSGDGIAALALLRRSAKATPGSAKLMVALADALLAIENRPAANAAYRRALAALPDDEPTIAKLAWSLLNSRHGDESQHLADAHALVRGLLARGRLLPGSAHTVQSVLLRVADLDGLDTFDALFADRAALQQWWVRHDTVGALHAELARVRLPEDRSTLVACHRAWGAQTERLLKPLRPNAAARLPGERIRVGFMSSDLRHHPVAYFAQPIFQHHDRSAFDLFAYSFHPGEPDAVQRSIMGQVSAFRSMPGQPDEAIAATIAADRLDILFELGGSTHLNRLQVLAHQPAPVQVSWLGYPHSSGVSRISHILVDPYVRPPDPALLIERAFEMPSSWVPLGPLGFHDQEIIAGLPEDRAGCLTFGTMNNPYKYTREAVAVWAEIMQAVPSSRFLFVRPEAGAALFRDNMARAFARHGVAADRLAFHAVRGRHMPYYNEIDIALDTLPQTGGTTTCECLWMGVPTVTLAGAAFFERLSHSTLANAGLGDLAAPNAAGYVARALALAADRPRRSELRRTLRSRLRASPLGDGPGWVRDLQSLICHTLGAPSI